MSEILLHVAPFLNPSPNRNAGGDCFACALKACVDALYPERPIAFSDAWEAFEYESDGHKYLRNVWPGMRDAIYRLSDRDYDFNVRYDLALGQVDIDQWSHQFGIRVDEGAFAYRLEAWLSAGWLAIVEMNMAGSGPVSADGTKNHTDHFAVLDGQRHFWQGSSVGKGASSLDHETHVVCSRKGGYWINTSDLLERHGVAALTLIRRDETERRPA